jgi:hypothetical protein
MSGPWRFRPGAPRSRWGSRLLFLGVFLFAVLVALAALSIRQEWQRRIGQSRADVIFQLVQGKIPARPLETPGASAWLNFELRRYRERIADPTKARLYGEVAEWQDTRSVPPFFAPLRQLLARPVRRPEIAVSPVLVSPDPLHDPPKPSSLRAQSFLELDRHWFAMTRRMALESGGVADLTNPSNRFLAFTMPHLLDLSAALPKVLAGKPATAGGAPLRSLRRWHDRFAARDERALRSRGEPAGRSHRGSRVSQLAGAADVRFQRVLFPFRLRNGD